MLVAALFPPFFQIVLLPSAPFRPDRYRGGMGQECCTGYFEDGTGIIIRETELQCEKIKGKQ
jgi:hypothetical protein